MHRQGWAEQKTHQANKNDEAFQFRESKRSQVKMPMDTGIYGFLNEGIFYVYRYTAHQSTGHIHVCMSSAGVFFDNLVLNLIESGEKIKQLRKSV